ncbi:EAL domain-containing protein [Herbaspirillum seropedicae]|uniref:EAL domain-containing protein n=1 Tax=Herbaspirillum seropedicae TaxID=964 RepID=UPI0028604AAA|nr:EAL domain-containing protein [Herbaspirillum seropedicae]MDR6398031.1 EAL domain-containing protein (putative c-di-GMP-specific phosphodiesterase class I) [Herbaspirillum seropedicae]
MLKNHSDPLMISASHNPHQLLPFVLQPIMNIAQRTVYGYEILYRGIPPQKWADIDVSVIRFLQTLKTPTLEYFVNVANDSLLSLQDDEFLVSAKHANVHFELSEVFTSHTDFDAVVSRVNSLAAKGVRFALDDFGAGMDGLLRLYSLKSKVAAIKIDRQFMLKTEKSPEGTEVLKSLIARWKENGVTTIAEGIESAEMLEFATACGADMAQGYLVDEVFRDTKIVEQIQFLPTTMKAIKHETAYR